MEKKLELNQLAIDALRDGSKWTFFLSIVGFVGVGLMLIAAIFMAISLSDLPDESAILGSFGIMKNIFSLFYFIMAGLYFIPVYYLYKYSANMKTALQFGDSNLVAIAFVNLKSHHKFLGISIIVILSLYLLILIGGIFAIAASTAF